MTLTELCQEVRNWFCADRDKHIGDFTIDNGTISPPIDIKEGQYFRIVGSTLLNDINDYEAKYGSINLSPYQSESFAGYSYSKAAKGSGNSGSTVTWRDAFKSRLNKYRKI